MESMIRCASAADLVRRLAMTADDRELVAAETRGEISGTGATAQPQTDELQQRVADRMPQRIVDVLEPVEIEPQHGKSLIRPHAGDGLAQLFPEERPVRQIGELIVMRQMGDAASDAGVR